MPSPCRATGFYKRKGGAFKKGAPGKGFKHVGYGKGTHSKRDPQMDRSRRAKRSSSLRRRYPNHYD
jgi:hypothetical protein